MNRLKWAKGCFWVCLVTTMMAFRHTPKWYHLLLWFAMIFFVDALSNIKALILLNARIGDDMPDLPTRGKKK